MLGRGWGTGPRRGQTPSTWCIGGTLRREAFFNDTGAGEQADRGKELFSIGRGDRHHD